MARVGRVATGKLQGILAGESGLNLSVAAISEAAGVVLAPLGEQQVMAQNVAAELAERSSGATYPAVHIYCERVQNQLREKFRTFSGKARLAAEIRVSQDRLEGIEEQVQLYADALTKVLDGSRGDWGDGMFYTGGYEVVYNPVKHGGKNFLQTAKVTFEVDVSIG